MDDTGLQTAIVTAVASVITTLIAGHFGLAAARVQSGAQVPTSLKTLPAFAALCSMVALGVLGVLSYQRLTAPTSAVVAAPTNGDPINTWPYHGLRATVQNVPKNVEPLLVIQDPRSRRYNPGSHLCTISNGKRSGSLSCDPLYIGKNEQTTGHFNVLLVLADANAREVFERYNATAVDDGYPGMPDLPNGVKVLATRDVIRQPVIG